MKTYLTFRSTTTNPQGTCTDGKKVFKAREYAQSKLLYEALSVEFEAKDEPRMYYPIACWGFQLDISNVHVLLLLESMQEPTDKNPLTFQIDLIGWRLWFGNFIFRKEISKAVKAVETAIETLVDADQRLSECKRLDRDRIGQFERRTTEKKATS